MQYVSHRLPGPQRPEQFNVRQCTFVLGVYGVITLISYFNELAKSGLLYGSAHHYPHYAPMSNLGNQESLIERVGDTINLDVSHLKEILNSNTSRSIRSANEDGQINIAVHLGRNASYETSVNNSGIQVISYRNVMPNFFHAVLPWESSGVNATEECKALGVTEPGFPRSSVSQNESSGVSQYLKEMECCFQLEVSITINTSASFNASRFQRSQKDYLGATKVFLYQHEIGGYAMRDCFKWVTKKAGLNLLSVPLNQAFRQEWDFVPAIKKSQFQALYGSLSFGVCENIKRPCLYATMMTHPLDRILQVYFECRQNASQNLCNFYRSSNITQGDLLTFIKAMGNSYFKKLIYHFKQCRLIGEDEICIQDGKASFILSPGERKAYLQSVLKNLENWFAVIGLIDHYKESLKLFEYTLGLNFTNCPVYSSMFHQKENQHVHTGTNSTSVPKRKDRVAKKVLKSDIKALRTKLLTDPHVVQWLFADLAIYEKATSLFHKQWATYKRLRNVSGAPASQTRLQLAPGASNVNESGEDPAVFQRKGSDVLLLEKTYASISSEKTKRSLNGLHTQPYKIKNALRDSRKKKRKNEMQRRVDSLHGGGTITKAPSLNMKPDPRVMVESGRNGASLNSNNNNNLPLSNSLEKKFSWRNDKMKQKKDIHMVGSRKLKKS